MRARALASALLRLGTSRFGGCCLDCRALLSFRRREQVSFQGSLSQRLLGGLRSPQVDAVALVHREPNQAFHKLGLNLPPPNAGSIEQGQDLTHDFVLVGVSAGQPLDGRAADS